MLTILGWESIGQARVVAQRNPSWSSPRVSGHTRLVLSWASTRGDQASPVLHTVTVFRVTSCHTYLVLTTLVLTRDHTRAEYFREMNTEKREEQFGNHL